MGRRQKGYAAIMATVPSMAAVKEGITSSKTFQGRQRQILTYDIFLSKIREKVTGNKGKGSLESR